MNHTQGNTISENLKIKCGIFQGDSFSLHLFCLVLLSPSYKLNKSGYGYHIYELRINNLFYMNGLKLHWKNVEGIEWLFSTVKIFTNDIGMEFGLDKYPKVNFITGG